MKEGVGGGGGIAGSTGLLSNKMGEDKINVGFCPLRLWQICLPLCGIGIVKKRACRKSMLRQTGMNLGRTQAKRQDQSHQNETHTHLKEAAQIKGGRTLLAQCIQTKLQASPVCQSINQAAA